MWSYDAQIRLLHWCEYETQHGLGAVARASLAWQARERGNFWKSGNRLHFLDCLSPEDGKGCWKPQVPGEAEDAVGAALQVTLRAPWGEEPSVIIPRRTSGVWGASRGHPGGVQGVSGGVLSLPSAAGQGTQPTGAAEGMRYETACGRFGGKWDKCVGVKGALGQSDICDRLCIVSSSSLIWKGRLDVWGDHGALETISRFLHPP